MALALRPTLDADLDAVHAAEADPDTRRWIGDVGDDWHRRALADPDHEHLTLTAGAAVVAFALLAGLRNPHRSIELRRILTTPAMRGKGHGRAALLAVVTRGFAEHGAHRVWLDVKSTNVRARGLYTSAGFVEEGELREAMREPDGSYTSLTVMSVLAREWSG